MVSFMRRAEGLSHGQFVRHWTEKHTPLARAHHVGSWNYTQNVVRRAYTPGGDAIDGIAELHFRTRADFEERVLRLRRGPAPRSVADVKTLHRPQRHLDPPSCASSRSAHCRHSRLVGDSA